MNVVGELSLLVAFVASGFAAFACVVGAYRGLARTALGRQVRRRGQPGGVVGGHLRIGLGARRQGLSLTPTSRSTPASCFPGTTRFRPSGSVKPVRCCCGPGSRRLSL